MRKIFLVFLFLSFITGMLIITPFMAMPTLLDPIEQAKAKEGKTFWKWDSPYGSYHVHYIEKGNGPRHVLLLHGFRAHVFTWRHLIDPLVEAGYHVWAMDLIGFGLSDKPENVPYTIPFYVDQVDQFLKDHDIPHAHLIGNSMGGGLALQFALHRLDPIDSLTLIDALGYPLNLNWYLLIGQQMGHLLIPFLNPLGVKKSLEQIMFNPQLISDEQVMAYSLPYCLPGGIHAAVTVLSHFDNRKLQALNHRFSEIQRPILLIWGEQDSLIPVSHFEKFRKDFPNADTLLIPQCGHIPQEEKPELVTQKIIQFLNPLAFPSKY